MREKANAECHKSQNREAHQTSPSSIMFLSWHSPTHAKNKRIFLAIAVGTGVVLVLLQVVANKLFSKMLTEQQATPSNHRKLEPVSHQEPAFERPVSLFQDDFFSSPFMIDSELLRLKQEMDLQMAAFQQEFVGSPLLRGGPPSLLSWDGGFDFHEDDNMVRVVVSIPDGIGADDINIEVIDEAVMRISGGIMDPMNRVARVHFDKRFALGRDMEQDKIAASLKDGTLTVTTPKAGLLEREEKDVVRKIPIKEEL